MAKKKRKVVGSVCKSKDAGKPDYIKMREGDVFYSLESPAYQLKSLQQAVADGKLSEDVAKVIQERIEKVPNWVRFELVQYVDAEDEK